MIQITTLIAAVIARIAALGRTAKTVDEVLHQFIKAADKLESLADKHHITADKHLDTVDVLMDKADAAREEAKRAADTALRLRSLVG